MLKLRSEQFIHLFSTFRFAIVPWVSGEAVGAEEVLKERSSLCTHFTFKRAWL